MKDTLVKAIARKGKVRILACTTTQLCEQARLQHDLWPTSAAALGRVLSMGAMMGSMLKTEQEKLTIQINGGGAMGTVMVDAFANGDVRGFVGDPHIYLKYNDSGKLAVGAAIGREGTLKVIKNLGMKNDFTGTVALQSGEIGDDFAYYFTVSEQTPSAVSVGVLVDTDQSILASGGFIIQMMPDAEEEDIVAAETAIRGQKPVSELIRSGMDAQTIASSLFDDVQILETRSLRWHCGCSRKRFFKALFTLPKEELEAMVNEDHGCQVKCEFCNTTYDFSEKELRGILELKASCGK